MTSWLGCHLKADCFDQSNWRHAIPGGVLVVYMTGGWGGGDAFFGVENLHASFVFFWVKRSVTYFLKVLKLIV